MFSTAAQLPLVRGAGGKLAFLTAALGTVLGLAGLVSFFGLFVYFRRFALRIPDLRLAQNTRTVMWGFVISYGVMMLVGLATVALAGATGTGTAPAVGVIGGGMIVCAATVAVLVFVCWAYRLLLQYNRAFKQAAFDARSFDATSA